ncbi:hypothetical protein H5410_042109 [Solanum commersonii]|uniref:Uncharacterized protein n=1 Tax=Solanum commersonii TaxID=4109 RepID=A0A9J5XTE8_SOLCO|nr:hypothetical protein H5410_042109 [Solanum commersonii]
MAFRKSSDFSYKDSSDVISTDLSHFVPITRRKFKNSGLNGSEYFTSLEAMKNNNSHTMVVSATPRGNLASMFFEEFSQIGSNFGESEDSMDAPTSMNVNALIANSTDMDEKFAMMEQTIEALKKFVDDKNLHIAQLMNKLEAFTPGDCCTICPTVARHDNKHYQRSIWQNTTKFLDETAEANHASVTPNQKKCSRSTFLQFGSLTPIEVDFLRKTLEGSLEIDNHKENEIDGWTLVTHKKRRHQVVFRIRLPKTRAIMSDKVRRPITLDEFFPEKFFCGSQIGATHVISSTDETKGNKCERNLTITQEHQTYDKVSPCCATIAFTDDELLLGSKLHNRPLFVVESIREHHLNLILIDGGSAINIMPKVILKKHGISIDKLSKSNLTIQGFNQGGQRSIEKIRKHAEADSIDLEDSKVQWVAIKISNKRTEEVSINLSPSKGDMQANVDDEQPIFRYIPHLKEKMTVPVTQVPSFTLEPSKGNTQVGQIKGNFDQKVFTLFEKSGYNFSNPVNLGELMEEVTSEKIHGLTKSQTQLREKEYYVATPKFGLGFSLPEPLWISSKNRKEITSSHYTSIEKTKESKEGKTPQRASVFECIGRLTPRVSAFERFSCKDERGSSNQVDKYATTSKTSVFHRLGTKRNSLSERRLPEHENQDSCDIIDDKENHSFHKETNKEEYETVIVEIQMEDSNLTESSYHITMEEGSDIDDTDDDVQEAPPQLEDGIQSIVDDLKELNLGTLEESRPIFISALLTPEKERKYFKLLVLKAVKAAFKLTLE